MPVTWDPLTLVNGTLINNNLEFMGNNASDGQARGNVGLLTGKYYFEIITRTTMHSGKSSIGIANSTALPISGGTGADGYACLFFGGHLWIKDVDQGAATIGFTLDVDNSIAVDLGAKLIWGRRAGDAWSFSGDPAAGTGGKSFSGFSGPYFPICTVAGGQSEGWEANFGATAYARTPPSGFGNWPSALIPIIDRQYRARRS